MKTPEELKAFEERFPRTAELQRKYGPGNFSHADLQGDEHPLRIKDKSKKYNVKELPNSKPALRRRKQMERNT
jgi:hypothetical protein